MGNSPTNDNTNGNRDNTMIDETIEDTTEGSERKEYSVYRRTIIEAASKEEAIAIMEARMAEGDYITDLECSGITAEEH